MLVAAALGVGAFVPIQTAVNDRLRASIGSPIPTAFVSVFSAFLFAVIIALVVSGGSFDLARAAGEPWWVWIGGIMGVIFITGNVIIFPKLGVVETIVIPILGQVIMALAIDHFALFAAVENKISLWRLVGAAVVIAGIVMVHVVRAPGELSSPATEGDAGEASVWIWRAVGVMMGMCSAIQTAVNGYLGTVLDSSVQAGSVNLAVGSVLLLTLSLSLPQSRRAVLSGVKPGPWWMWIGGTFGTILVVGAAMLAPVLGTGTTVIGMLAGTIVCGQIIEAGGLLGTPRQRLQLARVIGLILVFVGVAMVRVL